MGFFGKKSKAKAPTNDPFALAVDIDSGSAPSHTPPQHGKHAHARTHSGGSCDSSADDAHGSPDVAAAADNAAAHAREVGVQKTKKITATTCAPDMMPSYGELSAKERCPF